MENKSLIKELKTQEESIKQLINQLETNHLDHRDATLTRLAYFFYYTCQDLRIDRPGIYIDLK